MKKIIKYITYILIPWGFILFALELLKRKSIRENEDEKNRQAVGSFLMIILLFSSLIFAWKFLIPHSYADEIPLQQGIKLTTLNAKTRIVTIGNDRYTLNVVQAGLTIEKNGANKITKTWGAEYAIPWGDGGLQYDGMSVLVANNRYIIVRFNYMTRCPYLCYYRGGFVYIDTQDYEAWFKDLSKNYIFLRDYYISDNAGNCVRLADMQELTGCTAVTTEQQNNSNWINYRINYTNSINAKTMVVSFWWQSNYSWNTPVTLDIWNASAWMWLHSTIPEERILRGRVKTKANRNIREFFNNIDGNYSQRAFCVDFWAVECFSTIRNYQTGRISWGNYLTDQIDAWRIPIGIKNNSTLLVDYGDYLNFTNDLPFWIIGQSEDEGIYLDNYFVASNNPIYEYNEGSSWGVEGGVQIACDPWSTRIVNYTWSVYAPLYGTNYQCIANSSNQTLLDCEFTINNTRNNQFFGTGTIYNVYTGGYDLDNLISVGGTWSIQLPWINDGDAVSIVLPAWIHVMNVSRIWTILDDNSKVYRVWPWYSVNFFNNQKVLNGLGVFLGFYNWIARTMLSNNFYNTSQEELSQGIRLLFLNTSISPLKNEVMYNVALVWNIGDGIYEKTCCTSEGSTYCNWSKVTCAIDDDECLWTALVKIDDEENRNAIDDGHSNIGTPPTSTWSIIEACNKFTYWSAEYRACINSTIWIPSDQWGFELLNNILPNDIEQRNIVDEENIQMSYTGARQVITWLSQNDKNSQGVFEFVKLFFIFIALVVGVIIIFSPRGSKWT